MTIAIGILALAAILLCPAAARAQEGPAPPEAPSVSTATTVSDPLEAKVTVRLKNAPLAAYLDSIASQAQVNFILADGLEGVRVTAFLREVTVREALELLRVTKGLTYRSVGSSTMIAPASKRSPKRRTKVYPLQHVGPQGP